MIRYQSAFGARKPHDPVVKSTGRKGALIDPLLRAGSRNFGQIYKTIMKCKKKNQYLFFIAFFL